MMKGIGVHIKVSDFEASRKFYEALGFVKIFEYGPDLGFEKGVGGGA